jgi:hypothetical protein
MGTAIWDAEAMDIISAGAAAVGTITAGVTGIGITAGGVITGTIITGITGIIITAGGDPSEKGRQIGGLFLRHAVSTASDAALAATVPVPMKVHAGGPALERSLPPGSDGQIGQKLHLAAATRHGIEHQPG